MINKNCHQHIILQIYKAKGDKKSKLWTSLAKIEIYTNDQEKSEWHWNLLQNLKFI